MSSTTPPLTPPLERRSKLHRSEALELLNDAPLAHEQTQPPWPPDHREPCGEWLLGKLQRNAHHRARARTRALLLFQLSDALVSAPRPQPALYPSGAPLWG